MHVVPHEERLVSSAKKSCVASHLCLAFTVAIATTSALSGQVSCIALLTSASQTEAMLPKPKSSTTTTRVLPVLGSRRGYNCAVSPSTSDSENGSDEVDESHNNYEEGKDLFFSSKERGWGAGDNEEMDEEEDE
jgi:hypothetical protein